MALRFLATYLGLTIAAIGMPAATIAQESVPGSLQFAKLNAPYQDPGDLTAKELARSENISLKEAKSRLKVLNEAGALSAALASKFPDSFGGLIIKSKPKLTVEVSFTDLDAAAVRDRVSQIPAGARISGLVIGKKAKISQKALLQKASRASGAFRAKNIDAYIRTDLATGSLKVAAKNTAEVQTALRMRISELPVDTPVEQFGGIIPTASEVVGGYRYTGTGGEYGTCTAGFNVGTFTGGLAGISTAGHCNNNSGHIDPWSVNLGFKQEWITNGLDSQWSTVNGGSSYVVSAKFYDGNSKIVVSGVQSWVPGQYICKFGITTRKTCGYIDTVLTGGGAYGGTFPRVLTNSTYPKQSDGGDSGGPVFAGSVGVGQVHGRDPAYNLYFTPLTAWYSNSLPIGLLCCTP
ncbi:MAG: S1 family peptidase [Novosphingobium sp.]